MISVGIDVSKGKSVVCVLKPYGEVIKEPYELKHTKDQLLELVDFIKNQTQEVRVVMEATGHYHLPLLCFLQEHKIYVSVVNPMLMKKYVNVSIRKAKTDKLDAMKIAKFGLDYWDELQPYRVEDDVYQELRYLSRQYFQFMGLRTKYKVMFSSQCDLVMPGIAAAISSNSYDFTRDKTLDFVCKYKHYANIARMKEMTFIRSYKKWAQKEGYQFSQDKAERLYHLAKTSIPTLPAKMIASEMITLEIAKGIRSVSNSLAQILARMQALAKTLPEYSVVINMSGVGEKTAPKIIAEIGDVRRFHSAKALVAYAGIDTPPYESGQFKAQNMKISKRGSSYLRKVGFEIMLNIKAHKSQDDVIYNYIIKKEQQGKAKKQSMIAGLNKFLHIYYARVNEVYKK